MTAQMMAVSSRRGRLRGFVLREETDPRTVRAVPGADDARLRLGLSLPIFNPFVATETFHSMVRHRAAGSASGQRRTLGARVSFFLDDAVDLTAPADYLLPVLDDAFRDAWARVWGERLRTLEAEPPVLDGVDDEGCAVVANPLHRLDGPRGVTGRADGSGVGGADHGQHEERRDG